jgi:hypothetical protein
MDIKITDYEKLGAFYLGRRYDVAKEALQDSLVMYDSKDLVTHGVVLGMTGSGKTGLCLSLLEEAAIDNIPAIVIDPKGDIANLLLTFPELDATSFRPWINEEDAQKKNLAPDEWAAQQAETWKNGLASWGMSGERIAQFRQKIDLAVYTPGSNAGIPVSILSSLAAPSFEIIDDAELFAERIETTVTSLLSLISIDADPLQSPEHILLSNIFSDCWRREISLSLSDLIRQVQTPSISQIGVIPLDEFMPEKKRQDLALKLNGLIAAPGFQAWTQGVPLEIKSLLHTSSGQPRIAIFSIAHLNDTERMFFVSLLFNQVLSWMRAQSGTTSLRALLYMDEIFGYLPPTANPPSKKPMLTLLKQARAYGVGLLLATQNPVDLDYKALSNIGTWWLGRLQTERDKQRVLDGLEGAASSHDQRFDRSELEKLLSSLGSRVFLMNNTHEDAPEIFQVRWCLSYLRGPLTRTQIKSLMDPRREALMAAIPAAKTATTPTAKGGNAPAPTGPPPISQQVAQYFWPVSAANPAKHPLVYAPQSLRSAEILFIDTKKGLEGRKVFSLVSELLPDHASLTDSDDLQRWDEVAIDEFSDQADESITHYLPVPEIARQQAAYTALKKEFTDHCAREEGLSVSYFEPLDAWSHIGESEGDFRARLGLKVREARDGAIDELRATYAKKAAPIEERLRRAEASVQKEKEERRGAWVQSAINIGGSVLGALLGRKTMSAATVGRGATAVREAGRAWKQGRDVDRAEDTVESVQTALTALEEELKTEIETLTAQYDVTTAPLETQKLLPLKKNIVIKASALAWLPYFQLSDGSYEPAWE